jgi:ubiquinol oxidase
VNGKVEAPLPIILAYKFLCWLLDRVYEGRPIQRFWFLETVARMPYFSYISMLHLYESLGWWRAGAELRKVHFAEEWNELHHLQIMESLGGDQLWVDRFMAQHAAIFYYWILLVIYIFSPAGSYAFSELIEVGNICIYFSFGHALLYCACYTCRATLLIRTASLRPRTKTFSRPSHPRWWRSTITNLGTCTCLTSW